MGRRGEGCHTADSDPGCRENAAALNMHGPSNRMRLIRLLVGFSLWQPNKNWFSGLFFFLILILVN